MTAPLPAMVDGPVYAVPNVHISAGNVLPDALVTIAQNGLEVAQSASASAGMIWFGRRGPGARGQDHRHSDLTGNANYVHAAPGASSEPLPFPVPCVAGDRAAPLSDLAASSSWLSISHSLRIRRSPVQRQSPLNVSQCLNYRFTPEKPGGCNGTNRYPSSY